MVKYRLGVIMKINELLNLVNLDEMANAIQKYTGISGVVYFCTKKELKNPQAHAFGKVKLLKDNESVSISIKRNTEGERIIKGTNKKMIKDLLNFIELNENLLWEYWNTNPEEADSAETMRKFIKVK